MHQNGGCLAFSVVFVWRYAIRPGMTNERQLWASVLGLAFEDLGDTKTGYKTRLWFASDDYEPGSFLWICDHLELDAPAIRDRAFEIAGRRGSVTEPAGAEPAGAELSRAVGE
jgi:hypothetical protein